VEENGVSFSLPSFEIHEEIRHSLRFRLLKSFLRLTFFTWYFSLLDAAMKYDETR